MLIREDVAQHYERGTVRKLPAIRTYVHSSIIFQYPGGSGLKRAWYGSHHHYTRHYTPLYVAEACYKYNHRDIDNGFDAFLHGCFK